MKTETHFVYFRVWREREQEEASTFTKNKPFTQHCRIDSLSFFDFLDKRILSQMGADLKQSDAMNPNMRLLLKFPISKQL